MPDDSLAGLPGSVSVNLFTDAIAGSEFWIGEQADRLAHLSELSVSRGGEWGGPPVRNPPSIACSEKANNLMFCDWGRGPP